MQEQLIQKILDYLEQTEDFVLEQAPDVILQVLRYERITSILGAIFLCVLFFVALIAGYYFWKYPTVDKYGSRETSSVMGVMIPCVFLPFLLIQVCLTVDKLIKLYTAPKFFLIELFLSMKG